MATYSSKDVGFVLVGGYDVTADTGEIMVKIEAITDDVQSLGDTWPEPAAVGISKAEFTQGGFYNDATNASNAALVSGPGVSRVVCIGHKGNTIGAKGIGMAGAMQASYDRLASIEKLHRANMSLRGNGTVEDFTILQSLTAKTANWNTQASSIDNAASSAAGGAGYLQVTAFSGFTSVVLKVRHSADNVTFSDLITFTTVTSAPFAERQTVAGTVNRYVAMSGTVTGSGSITVLVGFTRN